MAIDSQDSGKAAGDQISVRGISYCKGTGVTGTIDSNKNTDNENSNDPAEQIQDILPKPKRAKF